MHHPLYTPGTKGKTLLAIGDSLTAASENYGGDYGNPSFLSVLKEELELSEVINRGIGSTCLARSADVRGGGNSFIERYERGEFDFSKADLCYIWYGHNDQCQKILLGAPGTDDVSTWRGALRYTMTELSQKFEGRAIFVTPLSVGEGLWPHPENTTLRDFRDSLIELCIQFGFPYIDVYGACRITPTNCDPKYGYTRDGIHMAQKGYSRLLDLFVPALRSLCGE